MQAWDGRQAWEGLQVLDADETHQLWLMHYPKSSTGLQQSSPGIPADQRESVLIHYDYRHLWRYPLNWSGLTPDLNLQYEYVPRDRMQYPYHHTNYWLPRPGIVIKAVFKDSKTHKIVKEVLLAVQSPCIVSVELADVDPGKIRVWKSEVLPGHKVVELPDGFPDPYQGRSLEMADLQQWLWADMRTAVDFKILESSGPQSTGNLFRWRQEGWTLIARTLPLASGRLSLQAFTLDDEDSSWIEKQGYWLTFDQAYFVRYKNREVCRWRGNPALRYGRPVAGRKGQIWWQAELDITSRRMPGQLESAMTPFYFDGVRFRFAAVPPKEPLPVYDLIDELNQSKRCWPLEDLNHGKVPPEAL